MDNEFKDLKELCTPIADYIRKNYNPYTRIVISDTHIKVISDDKSIPVDEVK